MILKSLQLQGFKSFPDKTTLTFDHGTTMVVGPNGSGKSNISDAMKWVLGEISSKNLRGSRMEDVIFGGTDSRKQMGFAEVSVTFDNTSTENGTRLATDFDEVTVTRRYYRAGESEYFINAKPVRLRDIHELFMNTGIGREGYSIIGQGKIAEILSRKSDERRAIFEEAAGIAKYKYKKEEAQKKLLAVEDNLLRVSDIVSELEARVGPLEKESAKARTYLELYEQKKQADISLWLYDMQTLKATISSLEEAFLLSKQEYEMACALKEDLENQRQHLHTLTQEYKAKEDDAREIAVVNTEEKLRLEAECKVAENDISHIDARLNENINIADLHLSQVSGEEVRLNAAKERYEEAVEKKAQADAVCEDDRMRADEIDRTLDDAYNRLSQLNEEISLAARAAGDLKAEMSALDSTKNAGDSKRAEILESKEKYRENITLLEQRSERAKESAAKYKEKSDEFEKQTAAANAAIADLLTNRKNLEEKQNEIFLAYSSKKNRIDNLSRMEELFEGYSRSVRFIMGEYEKGALPNTTLYGPLSKLITTDPKYATAIETALGANIQNIAVEDEESAKAAIRHLKINNAGRATFYPVTTMRASDFSYSQDIAKKQKGYIGLAHTLISYDKKFDVVIRSLLGRILVCDNIDHAAALARAYDYKVRIVTLDGQQVNAGGSFTGGSVKQDSGMLTRSVEIEKLRGECKQLSEQLDVCKHDAAEIEKAIKQQNDIIENIRVNAAMINTLSQAETTQQQVIEAQLKNDYDMLASLEAEEQKLANSEDLFREEYERLSELIRNTADKEEALRTARADTEAMREELSRSLTEAQRTLSRHQLQAAEIAKDIAVAESNVSAAEQIIRSLKDRAVQANNENSLLAEKKTAYIALIEKNRETIVLREQTIREAEEQSREYREQYRISEQKTNALYEKIREQSHTQELLYKQYTTAENKHKSALDEQDKKVSALWDEYELTYSSAALLDYPVITAETRSTTATQLASLKAQIKALGHVNVSAIEEYTQVKERYDFLTAQINDLTESRSELAGVIFHLEEEMRSRFSDAMREINHHFQIVFRELFGGGHAELILSEPDNILESGIEINVAPPGKIIKNLMLLSGGEQAFVAIALYFALLKVNPSPFCILDEIEAALDEVNVDKFADYLHRNSAQTQFIVITHRRGTMEVADKLYGVTMADRGISTVLSINANEVGNYVKTSES